MSEWISVENRLPDVKRTASGYEQIIVIAATEKGYVKPLIYERACVNKSTKYRWKWMDGIIYKGSPIKYWMPLPEPPEVEK